MHNRCCWPPDSVVAGVEPVFDLVEERGAAQRALDAALMSTLVAHARGAQSVGHVLEDGLGKGLRALKHHPDAPAELHDVDAALVDVLAV